MDRPARVESPRARAGRLVRGGAVCNDRGPNLQGAPVSKADDVFIRQFTIVLVLLAAYGVGAAVLGIWIAEDARDAAAGSERATLERIAPVGRVKLGEPAQRRAAGTEASRDEASSDAIGAGGAAASDEDDSISDQGAAPAGAASGSAAAGSGPAATEDDELAAAIYKTYCFACHQTGIAEAPPTGDTEAWAPRAAAGFEALYRSVVDGKGAMPPRTGFPHLTDDELKAGIRYLLAAANVTAE